MAQTLEEILRGLLGQQLIQIAALTSEVQRLQEQIQTQAMETDILPPPERPFNA